MWITMTKLYHPGLKINGACSEFDWKRGEKKKIQKLFENWAGGKKILSLTLPICFFSWFLSSLPVQMQLIFASSGSISLRTNKGEKVDFEKPKISQTVRVPEETVVHWNFVGSKNPPANAEDAKRHEFDPWVRKLPWSREWPPTPVFLPGKFHGQRSLAGCSPWGHKESDTTEQLSIRVRQRMRFLFEIFFL